jgi:hypothetical protein
MIRVFVETPKGRDSAGFTVPESAAVADVLTALRGRGWSPFARYASTLSKTRGSPLCWTGGARLDRTTRPFGRIPQNCLTKANRRTPMIGAPTRTIDGTF